MFGCDKKSCFSHDRPQASDMIWQKNKDIVAARWQKLQQSSYVLHLGMQEYIYMP